MAEESMQKKEERDLPYIANGAPTEKEGERRRQRKSRNGQNYLNGNFLTDKSARGFRKIPEKKTREELRYITVLQKELG